MTSLDAARSERHGYRILGPVELLSLRDEHRDFASDVLIGLSERPKRLPSRHFYDDEGSRLFGQIMDLPEYYLTHCERLILEEHAETIAAQIGYDAVEVVDLGAGDGSKTHLVLRALIERGVRVRYVPIDISEGAMRVAVGATNLALPSVEVSGIVATYLHGIDWLASAPRDRPRLVLFLGSNVGNFDRPHARAFLRRLWRALAGSDHVLIGFDLKKDIDLLLSAYNDRDGVTAAFNLNLLTRINRELGGEFDLETFRHFGTYDVFSGAMKSYLVSQIEQRVAIEALRCEFRFDAWEPVHTEYSYKYLPRDIVQLAVDTGFRVLADFTDARAWFVDSLWRVDSEAISGAPPGAPGR